MGMAPCACRERKGRTQNMQHIPGCLSGLVDLAAAQAVHHWALRARRSLCSGRAALLDLVRHSEAARLALTLSLPRRSPLVHIRYASGLSTSTHSSSSKDTLLSDFNMTVHKSLAEL